jgi:hypothetical protein
MQNLPENPVDYPRDSEGNLITRKIADEDLPTCAA